jgi:hypothetical protein
MTQIEFRKTVEERLELIKAVLLSKGKEYATSDNAFHNFEASVSASFTDSREKVAWDFNVKHLQSIKDMIAHVAIDGNNGYPTEEMIKEKFGDAINYFILIEAMMLERIRAYNLLKKYEQQDVIY